MIDGQWVNRNGSVDELLNETNTDAKQGPIDFQYFKSASV